MTFIALYEVKIEIYYDEDNDPWYSVKTQCLPDVTEFAKNFYDAVQLLQDSVQVTEEHFGHRLIDG